MYKACMMMATYNVPLRFWEQAVETAVYILNRTPRVTRGFNGKTPYELATGKSSRYI